MGTCKYGITSVNDIISIKVNKDTVQGLSLRIKIGDSQLPHYFQRKAFYLVVISYFSGS
jgi:hypothetical protein